ncbi:heme exporter protein CcmB [Aeromonas hydrophila]|uniref:heme exporter protein CcmB n=1 Tax=Aeromonas hydrophila TaxID=644 RepID=UPI00097CF7DF|nr:heme exporter protein CcmB [Aeromonas hydrophila]ONG09475.1 heme exporter protein CcmB [Aeromonas hydrophila]
MLRAVMHLIHRELLMALRQRSDILNPLWFFLIVITLFPLGIGPEPKLLARIAPGIIWVAALLAAMLSLERLFRDDFGDGALEQMMLMPHPLGLLALAKVIAHWLLTGLPLLLISPLLAILLSLDMNTYLAVVATLALGTPVLSLSLLILPLYIPVLIFATSAIDAAGMGLPYSGQLAILGAMLAGALTLTPLAVSAALRVSVN